MDRRFGPSGYRGGFVASLVKYFCDPGSYDEW